MNAASVFVEIAEVLCDLTASITSMITYMYDSKFMDWNISVSFLVGLLKVVKFSNANLSRFTALICVTNVLLDWFVEDTRIVELLKI